MMSQQSFAISYDRNIYIIEIGKYYKNPPTPKGLLLNI